MIETGGVPESVNLNAFYIRCFDSPLVLFDLFAANPSSHSPAAPGQCYEGPGCRCRDA
jgi:hypothetical protein